MGIYKIGDECTLNVIVDQALKSISVYRDDNMVASYILFIDADGGVDLVNNDMKRMILRYETDLDTVEESALEYEDRQRREMRGRLGRRWAEYKRRQALVNAYYRNYGL